MNDHTMIHCPSCGAEIPKHAESCPYCGAVNAYASETKYQKDLEGLTRKVSQTEEAGSAMILREIGREIVLIMGTVCIFLAALGILYLIVHRMDLQDLENLRSLVSHGL